MNGMGTLVIASLTFREAARRRILLAALVLGVVFLIVYGLGFHYISREIEKQITDTNIIQLNEMRNFVLMAGMYVVNFLTVMMTVLTSVDTISGEISSGTIHTLVSKPIRRWEVICGKWLGFGGMITLYLLLMGGGIMGIIYLRSGYAAPNPGTALSLMWLNALIMLSVSILGGVNLSTLANGVLVFGLYGIAFIGGWIEQIGSFAGNLSAGETTVNIGILTSLVMPSEALWKRAAHELQSPLVAMIGFSPFASGSYPSLVMVLYSVLYMMVVVGLAFHTFKRRDL